MVGRVVNGQTDMKMVVRMLALEPIRGITGIRMPIAVIIM